MSASNDRFLSRNQPPLNQTDTKTRFHGATIVITGGASGIGRATAERFLNDGAENVAIVDVNKEVGEDAKQDMSKEFSKNVHFLNVDVSDEARMKESISEFATQCGGKIDHIVACAAFFGSKGIDGTDEDFLKSFKVNFLGAIHLVQSCRPYMSRGSSIVLISSISAHRCQPERWTYGATKGALHIVAKDMALDFANDGIRVNSVSPGWIWTPIQVKGKSEEAMESAVAIGNKCAFAKRIGESSEVAAAVAFLCSKDAAFINGADLPVDGGYQAMGPEGHGDLSKYAGHDD